MAKTDLIERLRHADTYGLSNDGDLFLDAVNRIEALERALQEMLSLYDRDEFVDIRAVLAGAEKQPAE